MNKKLTIRILVLFVVMYTTSSLACLLLSNLINLPIVFWIPTALSLGFATTYGNRIIMPLLISSILLLLTTFLYQSSLNIAPFKIVILASTDIVASLAISFIYKDKSPFLYYIDDLKKYCLSTGSIAILQSTIIASLFYLLGINSNLNFLNTLNIVFASISVSLYTLLPFILSYSSQLFQNERKSTPLKIITLIALTLIPIIIGFIKLPTTFSLFPIQLAAITIFIVYAVKSRFNLSTFFIFLLSVLFVLNCILGKSTFNSFAWPNSIINAQYFSVLIALFSITISAILNERDNALQSLQNSYQDAQNEVNRQTSILKDINNKLIQEVEQRGLIEKELNLSKKLLTESQEIANITSWEYDLKSKTIRWSESASRILGIGSIQISAFSMERYIDRIHPDDRRTFLSAILQASESTKDINLEIRYELNNHYRHFLIRGRSFDDNKKIERIVGVLSDITDWKEAQLALSEKETRYRALFDTNIDPVILIDGITKTIVDVNLAFEKLYEYSRDEAIGMSYTKISAQEYDTHQALDIAIDKGYYRVPTRTHRKRSGEEFFVEGHFVKFLSNESPQVFAILRDNTSRKNYENRLAERELKFRLFFESNLIGMAETTIYKTWITFNTKLCQILGYKPEELEKTTWDKITHPNDLDYELKLFNNILQRKTDNYTFEKRFIKKDGSSVYCNVAVKAIKDNNGNITHLVKLIEDISPRKKAENALIESQNKLRNAQHIAHLGVCRLNLETKYLDISEEAFDILKWDREKAPFKIENFIENIHPSDRDQLKKIIEKLLNKESIEENLEARHIKTTGDISYLALNLGIALDANNRITDLLITFADITTSKLAEISLKEANAMKDQLFSVISHDLRGPIGSMEQMLTFYMSNESSMDDDSKKEIISLLHNTSSESFNLLENLLEWGRSQRQLAAKPTIVEIVNPIAETQALLSGMASAKRITFVTDITPECRAFIDEMMFKTIIRNLLSNAIKFTPFDGKITISATTQEQLCIIKVSDSGIGIPSDKLEFIFDDSKIFSSTGTNNEKGTGLGLKLVKRFIDKNSGKIEVSSEINKGTTFTITLPAGELNKQNML